MMSRGYTTTTKDELQEALNEVQAIKADIFKLGVSDTSKKYNTNLVEFIEFKNSLDVCEAVVKSALEREVSCGAHYIV